MTPAEVAEQLATMPPLPVMPEGVKIVHLQEWPGYAASSDGRIWSCRLRYQHKRGGWDEWRPLSPCFDAVGYHLLTLYKNKKAFTRKVHRLILEAFVGPRPDGLICCHRDGTKTNNARDNLRWDTLLANAADAVRDGVLLQGETHHSAKLTAAQVTEIRSVYVAGSLTHGGKALGKKYGVSAVMIGKIVRRVSWRNAA